MRRSNAVFRVVSFKDKAILVLNVVKGNLKEARKHGKIVDERIRREHQGVIFLRETL